MPQEHNKQQPVHGDAFMFVLLGWLSVALSFIVLPVLFAPIAVVLGILATLRGSRKQGIWIIAVSAILLLLYVVLGTLLTFLLT